MISIDEIGQGIAQRIAEARAEIASLEAARAALLDGEPGQARSRSSRRRAWASSRSGANDATAAVEPSKPGPGAEAATEASPRSKRTRSRRRSAKKPTGVLLAGKLESMLTDATDGLTTSAVAQAAEANPVQVRELLRDLENQGQVRRTGARRSTRWHLVTDEERIAARAAELAQRSAGGT